jgi:hypothetical protein
VVDGRPLNGRVVIVAASALGTMDLLFRLKNHGSLPSISDCMGDRVPTNAESLIGVHVPHSKDDLSKGIAIGSGFYIDTDTHIEATHHPAGSEAMGRSPRPWRMAARLASHPDMVGRSVPLSAAPSLAHHPLPAPVRLRTRDPDPACMQSTVTSPCATAVPGIGPSANPCTAAGRGSYVHSASQRFRQQDRRADWWNSGEYAEILFNIPGTATSWEAARLVRRATAAWWTHRIAHMVIQICTSATVR